MSGATNTVPQKRVVQREDGTTFIETYHVSVDKHPSQRGHGKGDDITLMSILQRFSTEESARGFIERILWPNGAVCPKCGHQKAWTVKPNPEKKIRPGLYKCASCRKMFTVTVNTIMEDSHIPMNKWLIAIYMMCASKTQVSSLQLQRQLELGSYQTALFMCHRLRIALTGIIPDEKLKGIIEADETYIGGKTTGKGRGYIKDKAPVVSVVERGGNVHSEVAHEVNKKVIGAILDEVADKSAHLHTDESKLYLKVGKKFAAHRTVNHKNKEYSRFDPKTGHKVTTNSAEGYFGNVKNSIRGTHHAISPWHTDLYMGELDFKYNTRKLSDGERTVAALGTVTDKRMTREQLFSRRQGVNAPLPRIAKAMPGQDTDMQMSAFEFVRVVKEALSRPLPQDEREETQRRNRVSTALYNALISKKKKPPVPEPEEPKKPVQSWDEFKAEVARKKEEKRKRMEGKE